MLYIHSKISNLSNSIMDNTYLTSNPLKTSVEEYIFLLVYTYSFSIDLPGLLEIVYILLSEIQKSISEVQN